MAMDFSLIASMYKTNAGGFEKAIEGIPQERWLSRPGK